MLQVRQAAGIVGDSQLEILAAVDDMYVARITGQKASVVVKLGPKYDMGNLMPKVEDGWVKTAKGTDWCVWVKQHQANE